MNLNEPSTSTFSPRKTQSGCAKPEDTVSVKTYAKSFHFDRKHIDGKLHGKEKKRRKQSKGHFNKTVYKKLRPAFRTPEGFFSSKKGDRTFGFPNAGNKQAYKNQDLCLRRTNSMEYEQVDQKGMVTRGRAMFLVDAASYKRRAIPTHLHGEIKRHEDKKTLIYKKDDESPECFFQSSQETEQSYHPKSESDSQFKQAKSEVERYVKKMDQKTSVSENSSDDFDMEQASRLKQPSLSLGQRPLLRSRGEKKR